MEVSKKSGTVNRLLTVLFVVMLIPFMMVSIWSFEHIHKDNIDFFDENLIRFTHNTAMESVNHQLEEIDIVFQILNSRMTYEGTQEFINEEKGGLHSIIASIVNTLSFFDAAVISDINNNYRTYPDVKEKDYFPSKRPWYPSIKNQKGIHYSEPYPDILAGSGDPEGRTITVSMNLFNEELQKYGNIGFDLDMDTMSSALKNVVVPFDGKFLVASKDGSVIMNANIKDIFRKRVPLRWIENSVDLEGHFYDRETNKYIYYRSFTEPYWVAFTVVDKEKHNEFIDEAPRALIYIITVCLIIYIILLCLCRVYIREIISRLYMGVNGINYDGQTQDLEKIYTKIKNSHIELKEIRRVSGEDALTGIGTRRKFDDRMAELINSHSPFYLAILDLDNFKRINDTFGHAVGDSVLKYVSKTGKAIIEPDYDIYRFGGEELVVLFHGGEYDVYFDLLETWRKTICQRQWRETVLNVSFSCGIARWQPGESAQDIITKADKALYEAKHSGKNAIYTAND
ncbi:sensor domain-containing diguanylate cyclase [Buttiauxella gaviniae]|uniref:sensor domain-containing diguanylate cyclase n=1 Tax=Buttiauxella gaviniae TaxID=82990 RepID=UPI003BB72157